MVYLALAAVLGVALLVCALAALVWHAAVEERHAGPPPTDYDVTSWVREIAQAPPRPAEHGPRLRLAHMAAVDRQDSPSWPFTHSIARKAIR